MIYSMQPVTRQQVALASRKDENSTPGITTGDGRMFLYFRRREILCPLPSPAEKGLNSHTDGRLG